MHADWLSSSSTSWQASSHGHHHLPSTPQTMCSGRKQSTRAQAARHSSMSGLTQPYDAFHGFPGSHATAGGPGLPPGGVGPESTAARQVEGLGKGHHVLGHTGRFFEGLFPGPGQHRVVPQPGTPGLPLGDPGLPFQDVPDRRTAQGQPDRLLFGQGGCLGPTDRTDQQQYAPRMDSTHRNLPHSDTRHPLLDSSVLWGLGQALGGRSRSSGKPVRSQSAASASCWCDGWIRRGSALGRQASPGM